MKKNSLTTKNIGQTVETGEYLGIVGSSGFSTGPHLHFEVRKTQSSSTYLDPFGGSCNPLNDSSLWVAQPLYLDPGILKVSVHPISPVFPECPVQETPNEDSCYFGGGAAKFYVFLRDQQEATTVTLRILRLDGSVVTNWTRTFPSNASRSYWGWTRTLPTETGLYIFEAAYNGEICAKPFRINCHLTPLQKPEHLVRPLVFPNPASGRTAIRFEPALKDGDFVLSNAWGQRVLHRRHFTGSSFPLQDVNLPAGLYTIEISDGVSSSAPIKLIISE
jgi:Peptidase family M23